MSVVDRRALAEAVYRRDPHQKEVCDLVDSQQRGELIPLDRRWSMPRGLGGSRQMVSFEKDVRPLFRDKDVQAMRRAFDLSSYGDVRANADAILDKLSDGSMPCDGPWAKENVEIFRRWRDEGFNP